MLRCAIFAPDTGSRDVLSLALEDHPGLLLVRGFDHFPSEEAITDFVRAHSLQVLFFDISLGRNSLLDAARVLGGSEHTHLVAIDRDISAEVLLELMQAGVREFLRFPFDPDKLSAALARIESQLTLAPATKEASDLLYSLLPAKPGAGASMTGLHTALELSLRPNQKVLYCDFDLNGGISRFLLKLGNPLGLRDAIEKAPSLNEEAWQELVSRIEDLDVLPPCPIDSNLELDSSRIRMLFEFARRRYKIIFADLSGALEAFSTDILRQSRRILFVVEPDLACIHLAREKMRFLEGLELSDRIALVINKWRKDAPLTIADIESVLGIPAEATISDSPEQMYKSTMRGGALDPNSGYFREIADLAAWLSSDNSLRRGSKAKRKLDYFSITPTRYSLSR
jgi:Flp pilus assembly CpaE family ATPase